MVNYLSTSFAPPIHTRGAVLNNSIAVGERGAISSRSLLNDWAAYLTKDRGTSESTVLIRFCLFFIDVTFRYNE